ncbi:MAG TPA: EAL domain-containing protein [Pseudolabrys sp.]
MTIRGIPSLWRYLSMLALILVPLVGGTWLTVKITSDYLLYRSATSSAQNWAHFLAANVLDLEQMAAGETPSSASLAFFDSTRKAGEVFRYIIFNRYGYSVLMSDHEKITPVEFADLDQHAARSITENQPIVDAKDGRIAGEPLYFAEAYVPILLDGRPVAVVAAYVDQTEERTRIYRTFLIASVALCLLTGFSFGFPAIAWYFRTKEKQHADRRIHFLAHHDALTGLANRTRLIERLDGALALLPTTGGMAAVHFIDVDHFKDVNDTLGHDGGDFLLRTLAQRLQDMTRLEDLVARLGGDEFLVIQTGVADRAEAETFAHRIASVLSAPLIFEEQEIIQRVTIGVAIAPSDGKTSERLVKSADLALYSGKAAGRNCIRFFLPAMDTQMQERLRLEKIIRRAVLQDQFVLHYQPIYEIKGKHLIGFEALVRLHAPDGTLIPPATFIPIAEEIHLIDKIGQWVLKEACRTASTWPKTLTVAVNLSPAQFASGTINDIVAAALKESGLGPGRLELEITESLLLGNDEDTMAQLKRLKALGTSIAMDDFGTGYSSLRYLWLFPFDKIKIDRSFMQSFGKSGRNVETVVKTIIALGREMNMRVTVEGVETSNQVDFLYDADADQVQGFYFGRPVPASEIGSSVLADVPIIRPASEPVHIPEPEFVLTS